jgi:hypothetical protein
VTVAPDAVAVDVIAPFVVRVAFEDGTAGTVDFRPWLWRRDTGLYAELRDPAKFAQVFVHPEWGHLEWPNGADCDPETLYEEAHRIRTA